MDNMILCGDALVELKKLPTHSVDSIVADPPCGIAFMGANWDKDKGGRDNWINWLSEILTEARRVIKPGGHILIWSIPRTSHWTGMAIENAGFEVKDTIEHIFGSGFPKSMDISKQLDRMAGKEREIVGKSARHVSGKPNQRTEGLNGSSTFSETIGMGMYITKPATPESEQWSGFGTQLKPSHETWWLARAPLAEKSIAAQVLATGTGGLNIDACRVGTADGHGGGKHNSGGYHFGSEYKQEGFTASNFGRFPANTLLSHTIECRQVGVKRVKLSGGQPIAGNPRKGGTVYNGLFKANSSTYHGDEEGYETVEAYECAPYCPIAELDRQSGIRKSGGGDKHGRKPSSFCASTNWEQFKGTSIGGDEGGASRYFKCFQPTEDDYAPFAYFSKPSRRERNAGCEGLPERVAPIHNTEGRDLTNPKNIMSEGGRKRVERGETPTIPVANHHPTVKSQSLMKYLCTLVTRPGGTVLDMFCGSGSTLVACVECGFNYIGIDQSEEYIEISKARVAYAEKQMEAA